MTLLKKPRMINVNYVSSSAFYSHCRRWMRIQKDNPENFTDDARCLFDESLTWACYKKQIHDLEKICGIRRRMEVEERMALDMFNWMIRRESFQDSFMAITKTDTSGPDLFTDPSAGSDLFDEKSLEYRILDVVSSLILLKLNQIIHHDLLIMISKTFFLRYFIDRILFDTKKLFSICQESFCLNLLQLSSKDICRFSLAYRRVRSETISSEELPVALDFLWDYIPTKFWCSEQ